MSQGLLDFSAACRYLSVKEQTLRNLIKPAKPGQPPELRAVKIGAHWKFTVPDLNAYIDGLRSNLDT